MAQVKKGARSKVKLLQVGASPPPPPAAPSIFEQAPDVALVDQLGYTPGNAPLPAGAPQPVVPEMPQMGPPPQAPPQPAPQQAPPQQQAPPPSPEAQGVGAAPGGASAAPSLAASSLSATPQADAIAQRMTQANADASAQSGKHAVDMVQMASFLPFLAAITGSDMKYASSLVPGVASNLIAGQGAFDEGERQRAFQVQQANFKNGVDERERNVAEANAVTARQKEENDAIKERNAVAAAQRAYELDLARFKQTGQKNERDNNDSIAKVRGEWSDRLAKLTPQSQQALVDSLDPAFKAYYGISMPDGGLETQNPNAPTEDMRLQKDLEAQYDLLKRDPKYLKPDAQKQIVKRIAALYDALGMASDAPLPPEVFANIDPATSQTLRLKFQAEVRASRKTDSDIYHQRQGERHDRAMEGVAYRNADLRAAELALRAELQRNTPGKDPMQEYQRVQGFVQSLQKQLTSLTAGSQNPLTGSYESPDPQKLQDNAQQIAWVQYQLQDYTTIADNMRQRLVAFGMPVSGGQMGAGQDAQPGDYDYNPAQAAPQQRPQQAQPMRTAAPQQARPATRPATGAGTKAPARVQKPTSIDQAVSLLQQSTSNMQAIQAEINRRAKKRGGR